MYLAPDGSFSATYPSVLRRLGGGAIDWVLCWIAFIIASIVGGIVQSLGATSYDAGDLGGIPGLALIVLSQLIVAASVVAYFAYYWAQGSTLGMRAVGSELVLEGTGRPPGWKRTVLRGIISWLIALAVLNVYFASSGRSDDNPFNTYERALIAASIAVAAVGIAAKAWMLIDGRRRSAFDRLFGLVYLDEIVFTDARRSPWAEGTR